MWNGPIARRYRVTWLGVLTLIVGSVSDGLHQLEAQAAAPPTPVRRIVFILADDLGWGEVGCFGQTKIPTPNIDRLAREGLRLTRHYSGAPVCAPSRCVLMTGRHLGHAEIRGNRQAKLDFPEFTEGQHPLSAAAVTFPQLLKKAGFATAAMGKWGLGPVGSTGAPDQKGFDLFFGYNCQSVAHSYYPATLWRNAERVPLNAEPKPGHAKAVTGSVRLEDWTGANYAPQAMITEAEAWLATHAHGPFFLYLPFIEPHVAMHPPRTAVERFPVEWDPEPYLGDSGYLPHPRPHAGYAAMISDLDSYVGRVLAALEKAGVLNETLIVFSSDNGTTHAGPMGARFHVGGADPAFFQSTANLRGFKGSVYEGGLRVPTVVRWPGVIPAGTTSDFPSYFADWFPTLCEAAGIEHPGTGDGQSLWPVLRGGPAPTERRPMVWIFPEYQGQVAVRTGRAGELSLKIVRQRLKTKKPGGWEVYDLERDPGETTDLAAQHGPLISRVEQLLKESVDDNPRFPLAIPGVNDRQ